MSEKEKESVGDVLDDFKNRRRKWMGKEKG